jgi:hypothetical protein
MEQNTKDWLDKLRNFLTVLLIGFALGSIVTNTTFTYTLMKDCELLKQFRVNNLAFTCIIK